MAGNSIFGKRLLVGFYVVASGGMLAFAAALTVLAYLHPESGSNGTAAMNLASNIIMLVLGKLTGILLSRVLVPPRPRPPQAPLLPQ